MNFGYETLYQYIGIYFGCFTRIGAAIIIMPIFGTKMVPSRIKLMLTIILATISVAANDNYPTVELFSFGSIIILGQQFIIGLAIGMVLQLVFQIFVLLGELIAMQSSLSFAVLNDPTTNTSIPIVSELYIVLVSFLFLTFDGHLYFCKLLFSSFQLVPISINGLAIDSYYQIIHLLSWMFGYAIKVAIPAITALLMVNIAFGIMTKAAPQLNIFAIGFPITMLISIIIIKLCLSTIDFHFEQVFEYGINYLGREVLRS